MGSLPSVAIVVSRYNASITDRLVEGAREEYARRGGEAGAVDVFEAPGAFELPFLARQAAATGRYGGVVTLGCIIRGETRHDRYIAQAVASGIVTASLASRVPIAFGVLTTESAKQARARAGGEKGNKGAEAMAALLATIASSVAIAKGEPSARIAAWEDKGGGVDRVERVSGVVE
ncbi:MAG: 6,7-dimethyl-8-ribityllumazine synthase [Phycisphaerae bacterium]|nr:6,7-dimethyl-8-ribityllumazine synthase [Phycisphaerae bacterium]